MTEGHNHMKEEPGTWSVWAVCSHLVNMEQNWVKVRKQLSKVWKWLRHLNIGYELQNAIKVQQNKTGLVFGSSNKGTQLNTIYIQKKAMW